LVQDIFGPLAARST